MGERRKWRKREGRRKREGGRKRERERGFGMFKKELEAKIIINL